ncbi:hypothetical protein BKA69DRAFT_1038381 [Paraphysoderma sedebokerense]|nr:hypothetical protein BKA69DRAFT_1038381 [Paraphysoderma sedebokerense]
MSVRKTYNAEMNSPTVFASCLSVISVLSITLNSTLLVIAKRKNLALSFANILIVCLVASDVFDAMLNFPFFLSVAVNGSQSILTNDAACKLNAFLNQVMSSSIVITIEMIALDRFILVCTKWKVPKSLLIKIYVALQIGDVFITILPVLLGSTYVIQPSQVYCLQDLTSNRTITRISRTHLLIGLNAAFVTIIGCYAVIILRVRKVQKQLSVISDNIEAGKNEVMVDGTSSQISNATTIKTTRSTATSHQPLVDVQKAIFIGSISICFLFGLCWAVYDFNLLKTVITKKPVSVTLDNWGVYFISLHGILNPLLILTIDRRFRDPIVSFIYSRKSG